MENYNDYYNDKYNTASNLAYVERVLDYGQVTPIINAMIKSGEADPKKIAKEIDNRFKGMMNKMENNLLFIKKITEMIAKHKGTLGPSNTDYEGEEVVEITDRNKLNYQYNDYGYNYKGYQLEVDVDEEPNERHFYFTQLYDPSGKELSLPEGGQKGFVGIMGNFEEDDFKKYIDSLI